MKKSEKQEQPHGGWPCLEFRNVWYRYGTDLAVQDVTFQVEHGEIAAILGPNGSGKTTLLKLALGLMHPSQGQVLLFGQSAERFRHWGRIGYVPQRVEAAQGDYPATAYEVVSQGTYRGPDPLAFFRSKDRSKILDALETVGLSDLKSRRISTMSVGQRQRVLLARALVRQPDLLVLDEPVAGVDAAAEEQFYDLLRRLNKERSITVLMVTHDIGAVMREATTVACINRTVVYHGSPHAMSQKELSELYGIPMEVLLHDALHEHR
ncbi:MAG: metal ABC transporter ATP-binding protein [Chloroflexi bacterium]|nr:metal ABC transporter ATP-binding protein [Chloroflexota bacterium]